MYAKFDKCDFHQRKRQYLRHVISEDDIVVHPGKIRAIMEWPIPKYVADIISFKGIIIGLSKDFPELHTLLHHYRKRESSLFGRKNVSII